MGERPSMKDEFYVGYLPVPAGVRRFAWVVVPLFLWVVVFASIVAAWSARDPGSGSWDTSRPRELVGMVVSDPCPMVYAADRGDGKAGWVALVEVGKRGAERAWVWAGKRVRVSGWMLERDGRRVLELEPGAGAIGEVAGTGPVLPERRRVGRVRLRGEIVDGKCYLGAMKPGEGKTHKECATLCIRGGIPAMLVWWEDGVARYALVSGGGEAVERVIGEVVEVEGELEEWGDARVIRVEAVGRV